MSVTVLFFASLREQTGKSRLQAEWQPEMTVTSVWQTSTGQQSLPENVLIARNQEYCDRDTPIQPGDEVAFFPPVTGG